MTIRKADKKIVGNVQIRHKLNEKQLLYGGHIGDSVRPSERRKGYTYLKIILFIRKNQLKVMNLQEIFVIINLNQ